MAKILKDLEPDKVFDFFEEICKIPHGSGNVRQLSDFCVSFARERGLDVWQDEACNVIIKKKAARAWKRPRR